MRRVSRRYRPGTLVLETTVETADGAVTLVDAGRQHPLPAGRRCQVRGGEVQVQAGPPLPPALGMLVVRVISALGEAGAGRARHVGQRRAAQAAPGSQQRHRLEQVGLARAIVAEQQHEPGPRLERRRGVRTKIVKSEARNCRHRAEVALRRGG